MAQCKRCGNVITKEVRKETIQGVAKMLEMLKTKIKEDSSLDVLELLEEEYLTIRKRALYC